MATMTIRKPSVPDQRAQWGMRTKRHMRKWHFNGKDAKRLLAQMGGK